MTLDLTPMECVIALKHLADKPNAEALFLKIARAYHGGDKNESRAAEEAVLKARFPNPFLGVD